jgi:GT2 family glycosyltransferase
LSDRPTVDVVIPFRGSPAELEALLAATEAIALREGDSLSIVDNRPGAAAPPAEASGTTARRLIADGRVAGSYYARNRGAEGGGGEWILFIDADVIAPGDLLDRYFQAPVADDVAVLAGSVRDEAGWPQDGRRRAARYTYLRAAMSQANTLRSGTWGYAQTANCAVRRRAFESVGGFTADIRSGGDADLCFRLRTAGWQLAAREEARAVHRSRPTLRALLRQRARHGSGVAWLNTRYPGSFPPRRYAGMLAWSLRQGVGALSALLGHRDGDRAVLLGIDVLTLWAFELGRLVPNRARRVGGPHA